jgi:N-acetylmuramoyl-L-alanine amidase
MTNPGDFEWIQDPDAQQELAETLAAAITDWLRRTVTAPAEEKPR